MNLQEEEDVFLRLFKQPTTPWGAQPSKGATMAIHKQYSFSSIEELDAHIIMVCDVLGNVPMYTYINEVVPYLTRLFNTRINMTAVRVRVLAVA